MTRTFGVRSLKVSPNHEENAGTRGHEDTERYLDNFFGSPTHRITASSSIKF
ncbi:MAG: hypothetical protein NHB32_27880 [Fischerella sp. CENA71]|nr:hypothetical protein [Fischerella sp. CENA71]